MDTEAITLVAIAIAIALAIFLICRELGISFAGIADRSASVMNDALTRYTKGNTIARR